MSRSSTLSPFSRSRWRRSLPLAGGFIAGTAALTGNTMSMVAVPWFVLTYTGSPWLTGLAAAAETLPLIAGSFLGGGLVDRYGARPIATLGDMASAVSLAAIPLLSYVDALNAGTLVALAAAGAIFDGPASIAGESRYPELARLAGIRLERLISLDELADAVAAMAGPALAGLVAASAGPEAALWMAAAFLMAAALLNALFLPGARKRRPPDVMPWCGALRGLSVLWRDPLISSLFLIVTPFVAIFGAAEAVIMPAFYHAAGLSSLDLGLFFSAAGGGALAGTLAWGAWGLRWPKRPLFLIGCAAETLMILILALTPPHAILLPAAALTGFAAGPLGAITGASVLARLPPGQRGRTLGAANGLVLTGTPLATSAAGALIQAWEAQGALLLTALLLGTLTLAASFLPGLQGLDAPERLPSISHPGA